LAELRLSREEMSVGREEASKIGRDSIDLQTAILNELQHFKEDTNRQLRENTRSLKDATSEMSNTCDDLNRQMKALVAAMKASR
jgi:recombinational DNA repair protein RecT